MPPNLGQIISLVRTVIILYQVNFRVGAKLVHANIRPQNNIEPNIRLARTVHVYRYCNKGTRGLTPAALFPDVRWASVRSVMLPNGSHPTYLSRSSRSPRSAIIFSRSEKHPLSLLVTPRAPLITPLDENHAISSLRPLTPIFCVSCLFS
jgi:hypothetical protein